MEHDDRSGLPAPLDRSPGPEDERPSEGILRFYDRLRGAVERRLGGEGRLRKGGASLVLLAPDLFILVARMALDRRVPAETRALLGGALAYFVLPLDLVPEAFLGVGGLVDDIVISTAVLRHAFDRELEAVADEHWSGSRRLREVLTSVTENAEFVLSGRGLERVRRYLKERGIDLDRDTPPRATP